MVNSAGEASTGHIEPLKKVILSIAVGTTAGHMELTPDPFQLEFIHGIGKTGLCPFEAMLINKVKGDVVHTEIPVKGQRQFLGHLSFPPIPLPPDLETIHLEIKVEKVRTSTAREMVRELAADVACGDDCCGH